MTPDDLPLTASEQAWADRAHAFSAAYIEPSAAGWEQARQPLPRAMFRAWADAGLAGLQVSAERGGGGAGYGCKIHVAEAMAGSCFATAFALNLAQSYVTRMEREGSPDQVARYLPGLLSGDIVCSPALTEPGAGSDLAAMATLATRVPGGWRLDGEKAWIGNGATADLLVVYAQTEPGAGAKGVASFLVQLDQPGVARLLPEAVTGGHAIGAAGVRFDGVALADTALFAPPGQAFKRGLTGITGARIHVAAMVCATVAASLAIAVRHASQRQAFGSPLLGHQGLRWGLADVATGLESTRALTYRAARIFGAGGDAQLAAAHAKKAAGEFATPAVAACIQAMGAAGLRAACPLGRHLSAAGIAAIVDGTTGMMNERIGAGLLAAYG